MSNLKIGNDSDPDIAPDELPALDPADDFRLVAVATSGRNKRAAGTVSKEDVAVLGGDVPAGGDADQILAKASGADFDTEWIAPPGGGGGYTVVGCGMDATNTNGLNYGWLYGALHKPDGTVVGIGAGTIALADDTAAQIVYVKADAVVYVSPSPVDSVWSLAVITTASGAIVPPIIPHGPVAIAQGFQPISGGAISQDLDPVNYNGCVLTTDGLKGPSNVRLPNFNGADAINNVGKVYTISQMFTSGVDTIVVKLAADQDIYVADEAGTNLGVCVESAIFDRSVLLTTGKGIQFQWRNLNEDTGQWFYAGNQRPANLVPAVGYVPAGITDGDVLVGATLAGGFPSMASGGVLGSAAFTASTAYATAAQGATADTAVQPGDLLALSSYVTSGLPAAASNAYALAAVTDALSPAIGAEVTGGGAVKVLVWSNTANWIVFAISP